MVISSILIVCFQVKASIFAASCISRLSDDFAYIILTLLRTTLCSKASCSVKIAAVRAFSKMQSSHLILSRAYKVPLFFLGL